MLAAAIYFALRAFTVPATVRISATLILIWLYILVAGAPPSAIRAGVVATFVLAARLLGRQVSLLHFMMTMLAAVFGILLLRKLLKSLIEDTLLRPFKKPPAQISTAPIVAASFDEVSVIGVLTNLVAVPLSGPILTWGLLGSVLGNVAPALAYPLNASNGFLVTLLEWTARVASSFPFATVTTPGITPLLVGLFYLGCVPAALSEVAFPKERWALWAAILVLWTALWLALVGVGGI